MLVKSFRVQRMKFASIRKAQWLVWGGVAADIISSELAVSVA